MTMGTWLMGKGTGATWSRISELFPTWVQNTVALVPFLNDSTIELLFCRFTVGHSPSSLVVNIVNCWKVEILAVNTKS